jgi:hypothetical protein
MCRSTQGSMSTGLLWFDGDAKKPRNQKIQEAATAHHRKFGKWPNVCYVHKSDLADGTETGLGPGRIIIEAQGFVLPGHYQVFVRERDEADRETTDG